MYSASALTNHISAAQRFTSVPSYPSDVEVDIQNHNLYSFSTAVKNIDNAADVICLYAGNNHFSTLDNITELPHLHELYVNENRITDINGINACTSLTTAVLSCNDIRDISAFSNLTSLDYLYLSGNRHLSQTEPL